MYWPSGEDSMSLGPRTMVDVSMYGAGAALKVGYMNGSGGVTPL